MDYDVLLPRFGSTTEQVYSRLCTAEVQRVELVNALRIKDLMGGPRELSTQEIELLHRCYSEFIHIHWRYFKLSYGPLENKNLEDPLEYPAIRRGPWKTKSCKYDPFVPPVILRYHVNTVLEILKSQLPRSRRAMVRFMDWAIRIVDGLRFGTSAGVDDWKWCLRDVAWYKNHMNIGICDFRFEQSDLINEWNSRYPNAERRLPASTIKPDGPLVPYLSGGACGRIPTEIIQEILGQIPAQGLLECRLLNRIWRQAVDNSPIAKDLAKWRSKLTSLALKLHRFFEIRQWEASAPVKLLTIIKNGPSRPDDGQILVQSTKSRWTEEEQEQMSHYLQYPSKEFSER